MDALTFWRGKSGCEPITFNFDASTFATVLSLARPAHLPPPRALLDPCCGSGTLLLEAAERRRSAL